MSCDQSPNLNAWYDGQLAASAKNAFQRHLAGCAECQRELRELQGLTRLLAKMERPVLSVETMQNLRDSATSLRNRVIARIAAKLTAAASILLAIGLFALWHQNPVAAQPSPWETMMVDWRTAEPASPDPETASDRLEIALWLEAGPMHGRDKP